MAGASLAGIVSQPLPSNAVEITTLPSGVKYAVLKEPTAKKPVAPLPGDIVAIEYTGYLSNGQVSEIEWKYLQIKRLLLFET